MLSFSLSPSIFPIMSYLSAALLSKLIADNARVLFVASKRLLRWFWRLLQATRKMLPGLLGRALDLWHALICTVLLNFDYFFQSTFFIPIFRRNNTEKYIKQNRDRVFKFAVCHLYFQLDLSVCFYGSMTLFRVLDEAIGAFIYKQHCIEVVLLFCCAENGV